MACSRPVAADGANAPPPYRSVGKRVTMHDSVGDVRYQAKSDKLM